MPLIIFCKLPKRKSRLLKSFLRFPHINRTVSDRETYISALRNLQSEPFSPVLLNSFFLPYSPLPFVVRKITNKIIECNRKSNYYQAYPPF